MRRRPTVLVLALLTATTGCHGLAAKTKRSGAATTAMAEGKAQEAAHELELEHERIRGSRRTIDDLQDAADEIRREREDAAEAAARQRVQYKKMLEHEIASIDRRVGELEQELARATGTAKGDKVRAISSARGWRALLKRDLSALERTGEDEWPEAKERIDRDLEDERPPSVPRSFDKSFLI